MCRIMLPLESWGALWGKQLVLCQATTQHCFLLCARTLAKAWSPPNAASEILWGCDLRACTEYWVRIWQGYGCFYFPKLCQEGISLRPECSSPRGVLAAPLALFGVKCWRNKLLSVGCSLGTGEGGLPLWQGGIFNFFPLAKAWATTARCVQLYTFIDKEQGGAAQLWVPSPAFIYCLGMFISLLLTAISSSSSSSSTQCAFKFALLLLVPLPAKVTAS